MLAAMTDALAARYPEVPLKRGHYESWYVAAASPTEPTAVWIRHTIGKPPGGPPTGAVWCTWFTADGPHAAKASGLPVSTPPGAAIDIGGSRLGLDGSTGEVGALSWDLQLSGPEEPLLHLAKPWMYTARLPRTKATSPRPDAQASGRVVLAGATTELAGWRGMLGHNWGAEHAARWIWLRGAGFDEDPSVWLDVVLGRIRIGPVTTPWLAQGSISVAGTRTVLGGIGAARRTVVQERADGARLVLPAASGPALTVEVAAPVPRYVGWRYADPDGTGHEVANCSVAAMDLRIGDRHLHSDHGAVFELGTAPPHPMGVPLQPYDD